VAIFQSVVDERREKKRNNLNGSNEKKKDMMDRLMEVKDENGKMLDDEEIIDIMVMYLNAGHESSGHITMWATLLLQSHPEAFKKAKVWKVFLIFFSSKHWRSQYGGSGGSCPHSPHPHPIYNPCMYICIYSTFLDISIK